MAKYREKYNIYIICKTEEDFLERSKALLSQYKSKICHIQWIPAEYLTLTQCNRRMLKDLNTRWNTEQSKIIAKLGTIAAHRKALLAIYMNKTENNIVLEADATLSAPLPNPPSESCYLGGWIIPPQITKAGEVKVNVKPRKGLNTIEYGKFSVLMAHALFIKTFEEAIQLFMTTIASASKKNKTTRAARSRRRRKKEEAEKIKNYDVHLIDMEFFKHFQYPPVFVQGKHVSEIDKVTNKNDLRTHLYGLNMKVK